MGSKSKGQASKVESKFKVIILNKTGNAGKTTFGNIVCELAPEMKNAEHIQVENKNKTVVTEKTKLLNRTQADNVFVDLAGALREKSAIIDFGSSASEAVMNSIKNSAATRFYTDAFVIPVQPSKMNDSALGDFKEVVNKLLEAKVNPSKIKLFLNQGIIDETLGDNLSKDVSIQDQFKDVLEFAASEGIEVPPHGAYMPLSKAFSALERNSFSFKDCIKAHIDSDAMFAKYAGLGQYEKLDDIEAMGKIGGEFYEMTRNIKILRQYVGISK